jgi:hypothetical protein
MDGIRRAVLLLLRAPFTSRAWRDVRFCAAGAITGVAGFAVVAAVLVPALVLSGSIVGTVIGLPLAVAAIGIARRLGSAHRWVLRVATGERITAPAPLRPGPGALGRLGRRLRDSGGWRAIGYAGVKLPVAVAEGYAAAATVIGLVDCTYPLAWLLFGNRPVGTRLRPLKAVAPVYRGQHWVIHSWQGTLIVALRASRMRSPRWRRPVRSRRRSARTCRSVRPGPSRRWLTSVPPSCWPTPSSTARRT